MIEDHILKWSKQTPDKVALVNNGTAVSYRSLSEEIARARGYFVRREYRGPGLAAIVASNLLDFWIISLALRSLGYTTITATNLDFLKECKKLGISLVASRNLRKTDRLVEICSIIDTPLLFVFPKDEAAIDLCELDMDALGGHILLTSGTTGERKFVLMSPDMDNVLLHRKVELTGMNQDSVLSVFDFAGWSAVGYRWAASPWLVGGTTVAQKNPDLHRALNSKGLTHAVLVPSSLSAILAAPKDAFPLNHDLRLFVGGGAMTRAQVREIKSRITPHLYNWLASTEAGCMAVTPLESDDDHRWHRLVSDRVVEIVDDEGSTVPLGTVGRLRIDAEQGPSEYLGDAAASKVFFRDGFFYPGDMAARREDGRISLHGRNTDVINLGGIKILPFPIEDRLCDAFRLTGVCILSMHNDSGEEEIHVAIESCNAGLGKNIVRFLQKEISEFSGGYLHFFEKLPRNSNGKIVRGEVKSQLISLDLKSRKFSSV